MSTASAISTLPPPQFVDDSDGLDPEAILNDMIAEFEVTSGRTLYPAQVERLMINIYAYREALVRNAIQSAGLQNLLAFAVFPFLDYIGQAVGVARNGAVGATTTIEFVLANALTESYTINSGEQIATQDGQFVFASAADLTIAAGATTGEVSATCTTVGTAGNGYLPGQVNTLLEPNSLIASVANTVTTANGAQAELDPDYKARIQLAPNQYSTAGPSGAYEFFARSASSAVIDAQVSQPAPGSVQVCILAGPITVQPAPSPNSTGIASSGLLATVLAALSTKTVRPLCDSVSAVAVTEVDYSINATVTLYADADEDSSMSVVNTAAIAQALVLASRIQRDIVPAQWEAALLVSGVYDVDVSISANVGGTPISPQSDGRIVLTAGQWANCTAITVTPVIGEEDS